MDKGDQNRVGKRFRYFISYRQARQSIGLLAKGGVSSMRSSNKLGGGEYLMMQGIDILKPSKSRSSLTVDGATGAEAGASWSEIKRR